MTPYSKAWWDPQEQQLSKSLDLKYFDWCHILMFCHPMKQNTQKNSYCSFLINWQWANTINLPTQWKVPLRTLQQQRSRENLESKSFEKPQGSVFQEEEKRIKCTEPGRWPRMSMTKRGRSWSLVDTRPDVIGSQWRYLFVAGDLRIEEIWHPAHSGHRIYSNLASFQNLV